MCSAKIIYFVTFLAAFCAIVHSSPTTGRHGAQVKRLGVPVSNVDADNVISNRYIVVYNNNATDAAVENQKESLNSPLINKKISARSIDGRTLSPTLNAFSMSGWRGMSLEAEDDMMLDIANMDMVRCDHTFAHGLD